MIKAWIAALLFSVALLVPSKASAATIERHGDTVSVTGAIVFGDEEPFRRAVMEHQGRTAVVSFDSPGGNVWAGLKMGELIRMRGLMTVVGPNKACTSICAVAWLAGNPRKTAATARIGFHAASDLEGTERGSANALVGAFLAKIGLSDEVVHYVTMKPPREMNWLKPDDAKRLKIDVALVTPEEFETLVRPATPPAVASPAPAPAPPAPAPAPPAAPQQSLEDKALWFVTFHRNIWSSDPPTNWTVLRALYADQVVYHEKQMTGDEVIIVKKRFAERVPTRSYKIRHLPSAAGGQGNPLISCVGPICEIKGAMDWRTVDRKGDAESGLSYFEYRIRWTGNKNEILLETSKVVGRQKVAAPAVPEPEVVPAPAVPTPKVIERPARPRTKRVTQQEPRAAEKKNVAPSTTCSMGHAAGAPWCR